MEQRKKTLPIALFKEKQRVILQKHIPDTDLNAGKYGTIKTITPAIVDDATGLQLRPAKVYVQFDGDTSPTLVPPLEVSIDDGEATFTRTQIPLTPGYAVTIHQLQGSQFDKGTHLYVHLDKVFAHGQHLVALTRHRYPMTHLHIFGAPIEWNDVKRHYHKDVHGFDLRMQFMPRPTVPQPLQNTPLAQPTSVVTFHGSGNGKDSPIVFDESTDEDNDEDDALEDNASVRAAFVRQARLLRFQPVKRRSESPLPFVQAKKAKFNPTVVINDDDDDVLPSTPTDTNDEDEELTSTPTDDSDDESIFDNTFDIAPPAPVEPLATQVAVFQGAVVQGTALVATTNNE